MTEHLSLSIPAPIFAWVYLVFFLVVLIIRVRLTFRSSAAFGPDSIQEPEGLYKTAVISYIFLFIAPAVGTILVHKEGVSVLMTLLGLAVYLCGAFMRTAAILSLGSWWSARVRYAPDHRLISTGIQGIFKHPYYIAVIVELVGNALILNAYWWLFPILLVQLPLLIWRARIEEALAIRQGGDAFRAYFSSKAL